MADQSKVLPQAETRQSFSRSSASDSSSDNDHSVPIKDNSSKELTRAITETEYPPTGKAVVILLCVFAVLFLVALDRTIIGTAIPTITDHFHSLGDVGWYAAAYMLTACSFILLIGRIYTFYNPKWVFLGCIVLFEIGSAICGAAPNSTTLIVGRAIAGLGSAGLFNGAIVIIVNIVPLYKRPMWTGFAGMVFGIASVAGPLLGGAFTDSVSWRWCFYINLPIGAVVLVALIFILKLPAQQIPKTLSIKQQFTQLDPLGTLFFLPGVICLILALQWGGLTYSWSNARIIVLLVLFAILIAIFIGIQIYKKETGTIPGRVFLNRSIISGMSFAFCTGGSMMTMIYFLPIWFQAIKGASAVKSGIMNIPMIVSLVITSIVAGILTKKIGYYAPWMFVACTLMPIGAGLISTFTPSTNHSMWIGYQVLYGFGLGFGMQQPSVAAQTVLAKRDVPIGSGLMFFSQNLGGTVFIAIANNIFDTKLAKGLSTIPGLDVGAISKIGATELRQFVPLDVLPEVVNAYNNALRSAFYVAVAAAALMCIGAATMKWDSVKQGQQPAQKKKAAADAAAGLSDSSTSDVTTSEEKPKEEV